MSRFRDTIGPALFEASFVVFGVVVAYAVNEWREQRVHRQDAASARAAITREMRQNRAAANMSAGYHQGLLDTLQALERAKMPSNARLFTRGFMMPAQLGSTAWEVAEQTGALNHMPFDDVLRFSRVYAEQRRYGEQAATAGAVIYQELYRAGPLDMGARGHQIANLINTFVYRERALVALYDSLLASPLATPEPRRAP